MENHRNTFAWESAYSPDFQTQVSRNGDMAVRSENTYTNVQLPTYFPDEKNY